MAFFFEALTCIDERVKHAPILLVIDVCFFPMSPSTSCDATRRRRLNYFWV